MPSFDLSLLFLNSINQRRYPDLERKLEVIAQK